MYRNILKDDLLLSTYSQLIVPQCRLHPPLWSPGMKEVSFSAFSSIPHLNLGACSVIVNNLYVCVLLLQTN